MNKISHKVVTGNYYKDIPIHAVKGLHEEVERIIKEIKGDSFNILDIGAGSGALTKRLVDNGYKVNAIELDAKTWMVENVEPFICDVNYEEWTKNINVKYDIVVALEIIEHLENPFKFIRDVFEILKQGGVFIVSTPNILHSISILRLIRKGNLYLFSEQETISTGHISILPYWLLAYFAKQAGFIVNNISFVGKYEHNTFHWFIHRCFNFAIKLIRVKNDFKVIDDGIISVILLKKQ